MLKYSFFRLPHLTLLTVQEQTQHRQYYLMFFGKYFQCKSLSTDTHGSINENINTSAESVTFRGSDIAAVEGRDQIRAAERKQQSCSSNLRCEDGTLRNTGWCSPLQFSSGISPFPLPHCYPSLEGFYCLFPPQKPRQSPASSSTELPHRHTRICPVWEPQQYLGLAAHTLDSNTTKFCFHSGNIRSFISHFFLTNAGVL